MAAKSASRGTDGSSPVVIKKYANRRLYNTVTSSYVTLDHLSRMVKDGVEFVVHDAKTGDDITRSVLTQIIVEEEAKGQSLLPVEFLRQLISFYGDSLQGLVPQYLEMTMASFSDNQEQIRKYLNETLGGMFPFNQFEEMSRRNLDIFQEAMNVFSPAAGGRPASRPDVGPDVDPDVGPEVSPEVRQGAEEKAEEGAETPLEALKAQLAAMQRQIDELTGK